MSATPRADKGKTPKGKTPKGKTPKLEIISTAEETPKVKQEKTPKVKQEKTPTPIKKEIEQDVPNCSPKSAKKSTIKSATPKVKLEKEIEQDTPKCSPKSAKKRSFKLEQEETPVKKLKASNGDVVCVKTSSVEEVNADNEYKVVRTRPNEIVVHNLPIETTVTDIKKSFSKYADIYSIRLSWFSALKPNTDEQSTNVNETRACVNYVISESTNKALDVFGAFSERSNGDNSSTNEFGVFIKNVPKLVKRETLQAMFSKCGDIRNIFINRKYGSARISFTKKEEAEIALTFDGKRIENNAIRIVLDRTRSKPPSQESSMDKSLSVLLQIGEHVNENDIRFKFGRCGVIKYIRILANRFTRGKHAYIAYENVYAVQKALKLNGTLMKGYKVIVSKALPKGVKEVVKRGDNDSAKMEVDDKSDQDDDEDSDEGENGVDSDGAENGAGSEDAEDSDDDENEGSGGVEDESDEGADENVQNDADSDDEDSD